MAADFIPITRNDDSAPFAAEILLAIDQGAKFYATIARIKGKMFRMKTDDVPPDFTVFATKYGIPAQEAGDVFDLINGTASQFENGNPGELINRVG